MQKYRQGEVKMKGKRICRRLLAGMIALSIVSTSAFTVIGAEEMEGTGTEAGTETEIEIEAETEIETEIETESDAEEQIEVGTDAPVQVTDPAQQEEPTLEEGQAESTIYGKSFRSISLSQFSLAKQESQTAPAAENEALRIPAEKLTVNTSVYINGSLYTGGAVEVMEGDNFSYSLTWKPDPAQIEENSSWKEGSWFELQFFTIPGLDLNPSMESGFVIDGIKIGNWKMTYDRGSGKALYRAVFNRYIQLFDLETIAAMLQGSGKFSGELSGQDIESGSAQGTLTVKPKPEIPPVEIPQTGTGWQPAAAPEFNNTLYSFGKGVKWNSSSDINAEPQIEWRVVFFEQLQKVQREFLKASGYVFPESEGYLIIEETLDENQEFYNPPGEINKYRDAPFFLELPVLVPGTGNILNGLSNAGDGNYDGPGEITPLFDNRKFTHYEKGNPSEGAGKVEDPEKKVRETPLSWTVLRDSATGKETLLINAGKLGTADPAQGVTWAGAKDEAWKDTTAELNVKISECERRITDLETGKDSPIALLDLRTNTLLNFLNRGASLEINAGDREAIEEKIGIWESNYRGWRDFKEITYISPLEKDGQLIKPLPEQALIDALADYPMTLDGTRLRDTEEYRNYISSLSNLRQDQKLYLENRVQNGYGKKWNDAKERYQKTLEFYKEGRVYGFVLKIRSRSVNTSMDTYQNSVQFQLGGRKWSSADEKEVKFGSSITGNYALGSIVLQKADACYQTDGGIKDIQEVEKAGGGLAGAEFKMYCGSEVSGIKPQLTPENQAHFLDKDASKDGNAYRYVHTGSMHPQGDIAGEIDTLKVNSDGKLVINNVAQAHDHWLVETKAPEGYYLDTTPVRVNSRKGTVSYQLLPNDSRSVCLYKADSYSGQPVNGAEFALFKKQADGTEAEVTGFEIRTVKGCRGLWKSVSGSAALKTDGEGRLCIHGLDAGSYVLREKSPAAGYLMADPAPEYTFSLSEERPVLKDGKDKEGQSYDDRLHILLNTQENPLKNEPRTASLTISKTGKENQPLPGAGFALARFTGSEEQWASNPNQEDLWEPVVLNQAGGDYKYFKTPNTIKNLVLSGKGSWNGKSVTAAMTKEGTGQLSVTDIPVGHYSVFEAEAPGLYQRDYRNFYFTVDGTTAGKELQLFADVEGTTPLTGNTLKNSERLAQLALVKYAREGAKPSLNGSPTGRGWRYTDPVLAEGNSAAGLSGAVYKLFTYRGGSAGKVNYDPKQLTEERILTNTGNYDLCIASGTTGTDGVLTLSQMKGEHGESIQGLNPGNYYLIEITAPDGYVLDQNPVHFALDESVFSEDETVPSGLVMTAANEKLDYGIRIKKTDGQAENTPEAPGLPGAGFTVKEGGGDSLLSFEGTAGNYRLSAAGTEGAVTTVVTDSNGRLTLTGLKGNTLYTLKEVKAPRGYEILQNEISIRTAKPKDGGQIENGVLFPGQDTIVKNTRLKGVMKLHKQEVETARALAGAEFGLYKTVVTPVGEGEPGYDPTVPGAVQKKDVLIQKKTTDTEGNLTFDNLEWEENYFIQETKAPEGYLLDETKRYFSINASSFDAKGNPIPVLFPAVINIKGVLGEAVLYKTDAEDTTKGLSDAHFYLEKFMSTDAAGKEIWVGYGKGLYKSGAEGEIRFLLPPGQYRLTEVKAPSGYLLEEGRVIPFSIQDAEAGKRPPQLVIDDGDGDGVIKNRRGEAGILLKKTLGDSDIPVPGVTFRIGWEYRRADTQEKLYEPLYFIPQGGNTYLYTTDRNAEGALTDLPTGADGMIYVLMPENIAADRPDENASLCCWETEAPDGIRTDAKPHYITLTPGAYKEIQIKNQLKQENFSVTIHKSDGKSRLGLSGVEFVLYRYDKSGENHTGSHIEIGRGVTDERGNLIFDSKNTGAPGLILGETYHVLETKAPEGYVLDQTHHEITLDESCFDENFHFRGAVLDLPNYRARGKAVLKKVDAQNKEKGLEGAEFELLHKLEADETGERWEHYGDERYYTDEKGILLISDLPYGSYRLVEKAAPIGYLLENPAPHVEFEIRENGALLDLGVIENSPDPKPGRDVRLRKTAEGDAAHFLEGAGFQLYMLAEDGQYHLRQHKLYTTDAEGSFVIEKLPAGNYGLKEIKAPEGYELPKEAMTYFTVREEDTLVSLQVENRKTGPEEPEDPEKPEEKPGNKPSGGGTASGDPRKLAAPASTGDEALISFWVSSALSALAGTGIILKKRGFRDFRKRREEREDER